MERGKKRGWHLVIGRYIIERSRLGYNMKATLFLIQVNKKKTEVWRVGLKVKRIYCPWSRTRVQFQPPMLHSSLWPATLTWGYLRPLSSLGTWSHTQRPTQWNISAYTHAYNNLKKSLRKKNSIWTFTKVTFYYCKDNSELK